MTLQTDLLWLFFSLIVSAILYPIVINLLYRFQFREKIRTSGPKSHMAKLGTPTMGGIGFFVITLVINLLFNFSYSQTALVLFVFFVAGVYGFIEDWFKSYSKSKLREDLRVEVYEVFSKSDTTWGFYKVLLVPWNIFREFARVLGSNKSNSGVRLKSHYKFLMHIGLGLFIAFWVYFKLGWSSMLIPFVGEIELGIIYPLFLTVFFVFTLNAVAITDGVDSLLAGITLQILLVYWVIALILGYFSLSMFIGILFGSLIVYLYFNVFPARVFMGDVGSYALAGALFMIPLIMRVEFLIFITHALCLFDGGISGNLQQLSVKFRGKRIFKMAPIHHHFELLGWHEAKVTIRFWIVQMVLALFGLLLFFYM